MDTFTQGWQSRLNWASHASSRSVPDSLFVHACFYTETGIYLALETTSNRKQLESELERNGTLYKTATV